MQRPRSSKANQRKLSRIITALNRDQSNRLLHLSFCQLHNPQRKFLDRINCSTGVLHEVPCSTLVQAHRARQAEFCIKPAQHQIRVGHSRQFATSVADWARISPRRCRPNVQNSAAIKTSQRTSTGADGMNIEHRHRYRKLRDASFVGNLWPSRINQRHVC